MGSPPIASAAKPPQPKTSDMSRGIESTAATDSQEPCRVALFRLQSFTDIDFSNL